MHLIMSDCGTVILLCLLFLPPRDPKFIQRTTKQQGMQPVSDSHVWSCDSCVTIMCKSCDNHYTPNNTHTHRLKS